VRHDATWKQAKVVVDLAKIVAGKDKETGERYGV
jgi:malyl-CoA/(S)-citramalyl-CoA lyase